jgi:hypothetical protein
MSPVYLANRPELIKSLPTGITIDDFVEVDSHGWRVTVGMKLARLGAYVDHDGKIRDRSGRRIEFFRHYDGGMPPPPLLMEAMSRSLHELKQSSTVIEMYRDPALPGPI